MTALETFFRSALSFSTCSCFLALVTGMIRSFNLYVGQPAGRSGRAQSPAVLLSLGGSFDRRGVQQNPRTHGRTQGAAFDVLALRDRRLGLDHAGNQHS